LSNDKEEKFDELMTNLQEDEKANVIVCFCEGMTVRGLLKSIKTLNLTNRFMIIGSDGWADRQDVVAEYEAQAVGSISIRIHSPSVGSFDKYYHALDPFENTRNPWFKEFWEDKFQCKMPATRIKATTKSPIIDSSTTLDDYSVTEAAAVTTTQAPLCTGN
jgi:metabotropic glutamate receptor 1